ncbi:MAG: glycoside hydrolase family 1 protein [Labilithrix sp.]|nr:glycoside hydrolase family 1 protein [Labilithrix sp.]MCW5817505.1 glycoside hydrolase family 1 protein [Labilithrix sp.]
MTFLRSAALCLGIGALAACSGAGEDVASDESMATASAFPKDFKFGAAIAGFQVDMGCPNVPAAECEDRSSDWYQWITTPRIVHNPILFMSKDPPSSGPGFFETYEEDLDRAANELGSNSVRLSIEWSRIFPQATWGITDHAELRAIASPAGLAFYHSLFRAMKARGLEPFVTVNHYSLPLWVHDGNMCNQSLDDCIRAKKAGWADPDRSRITNEIAKYAGFVAHEFGSEVDRWATLNEPFSAVVLPGYLIATPMRSNPPGLSAFWARLDGAKTAAAAMIEAHAKMYDAIKANDPGSEVGIVYAFSDIVPNTASAEDKRAAEHAQYVFHDMFMDGVVNGRLDEEWNAGPGKAPVRADIAGRVDFIGVNYYFRFRAKPGWFGWLTGGISPYMDFDPLAGFDGDPKGLEATLRRVYERYKLPLYVSETGADMANPQAGAAWMVQTMGQVKSAIASGIDVRGFYAWTLMDNYEWNHGMQMRMGLYAVDPRTKARTQRPAAAALGEMSRARDVPAALEQKYASFFP